MREGNGTSQTSPVTKCTHASATAWRGAPVGCSFAEPKSLRLGAHGAIRNGSGVHERAPAGQPGHARPPDAGVVRRTPRHRPAPTVLPRARRHAVGDGARA